MRKTHYLLIVLFFCTYVNYAQHQPQFSTAGFYKLPDTGREVFSMNPTWRFCKGENADAYTKGFNDNSWQVVSLPHGIELLPTEASGGVNHQGVVWYRKHFNLPNTLKGKKLFLHFEAIMGKSKVFLNGKLLKEHFGGYLPIIIDVTDYVDWNNENVIAVWADNSDDPDYPPGKTQEMLDFTYAGGIYRDCWLVSHNNIFITNANYENSVASGGVFVAYDKVSDDFAEVLLQAQLKNELPKDFRGSVIYELIDTLGNIVASSKKNITIKSGGLKDFKQKVEIETPLLWSPDNPYLYQLIIKIKDRKGKIIDGYRKRIGIRSIEFKGKEGFWLNGKPYGEPLIGANRHQDFAVIGNALPNSLHWRDAKKLRDAGLKVIRNAHYPQDPAFMDACDELGLFVIVNTPGWQFWNKKPVFEQRVYRDIRNMVRRDRNHASVWLWEPILNETWYPEYFAQKVKEIVEEEYPYSYCYSACDLQAKGSQHFPVLFAHPAQGDKDKIERRKNYDPTKMYFTREWGDNVDDWMSHNSPSRVARNWGEQPMLIQAQHYANPPYKHTSYNTLWQTSPQHVGGCLWHAFDHQRGYHPDPFYGGIMDNFRQPKLSYYMFTSQRSVKKQNRLYETGPMVHITHTMSPFSNKDVTVYSNCEKVRLTYNKNGKTYQYTKPSNQKGMPSPIITFTDVFDFMIDKNMSMKEQRQDDVFFLAEGIIDGKVVATHKVAPARRPEKILLWLDDEDVNLRANGSDVVTVVASIADKNGNIKRLNNYKIFFEIEGEGRLLASQRTLTNPMSVKWGTASVLVQSTLKPGKIIIKARVLFEGVHKPAHAVLELESKKPDNLLIYSQKEATVISNYEENLQQINDAQTQRKNKKVNLEDVGKQQKAFGEGH